MSLIHVLTCLFLAYQANPCLASYPFIMWWVSWPWLYLRSMHMVLSTCNPCTKFKTTCLILARLTTSTVSCSLLTVLRPYSYASPKLLHTWVCASSHGALHLLMESWCVSSVLLPCAHNLGLPQVRLTPLPKEHDQ